MKTINAKWISITMILLYASMLHAESKWGYIDKQDNMIIEPKYEKAKDFFDDFAAVKINNKWGFINKKDEIIISPTYSNANSFKNGLAKVEVNKKFGFINTDGNMIVKPIYDWGFDFTKDGLALVKINDKYGYINKKGEMVIPAIYFRGTSFNDGLAPVAVSKNNWVVINPKGELVDFPKGIFFKDSFHEGLAPVDLSDPWVGTSLPKVGFINTKGKIIIKTKFELVHHFSDGLVLVGTIRDKPSFKMTWGYMNKKGEVVIPIQYSQAWSFKDGLAAVKIDGKYGFIDKDNNIVIKPKYKGINSSFKKGLIPVSIDMKVKGINITPASFSYQFDNKDGYPMRDDYCILKNLEKKKNLSKNIKLLIEDGKATAKIQDNYKGLEIDYNGNKFIFFDTQEKCLSTIKSLNTINKILNMK